MADDREREWARPSLADAIDLLDLVRSSEDSARVSIESVDPALVEPEPAPVPTPEPSEEFVDVGDDAIDVAPSAPPSKLFAMKVATLPKVKPIPLATVTASVDERDAMPPVVGIVLVIGLAIGTLYAILAFPSGGAPPNAPAPVHAPANAPAR